MALALRCIASYRIALPCVVSCCIVISVWDRMESNCVVWYCIVSYCSVLYSSAVYHAVFFAGLCCFVL